jgi:hypothetical protein
MGPAHHHADEFAVTYGQMTPLLGKSIETLQTLVEVMRQSADKGEALLSDIQAIYGYSLEGEEIAVEHANEMAQLTTLLINLDVFLQSDVKMLLHVLTVADPQVVQEAAKKLDDSQRELLRKALAN